MTEAFSPPSIVVGIDGSPDALRAALWALPEARSRDIAVRLVCVAESESADAHATATQRLQDALEQVRAADAGVRVETAVLTGDPTSALLAASRDAAMVCVGAAGAKRGDRSRVGGTAGVLASTALCPVAVIRGSAAGCVAVELDTTEGSAAVLQFGVEEARLRGAQLRVLGAWRSHKTSICEPNDAAEATRLVQKQLDRRLSEWKQRYPDLDVRPVAVHGSMPDYLARNASKIQLVVVGAGNPDVPAALDDTGCSVLVVDRQRLL